MSDPSLDYEPPEPPGLWRQNHGNFLLGVVILISAIGAGIIAYQQNRFRKPRFPDGRNIETPADASDLASEEGQVVIKIVAIGAINDKGVMRVAVYNTATEFNQPMKAVMKAPQKIENGIAEWNLSAEQLPELFALAAYHDENGDGVLNKNVAGIPTERYGFSNNARGTFGPPTFAQAVINRPAKSSTIEVFIR